VAHKATSGVGRERDINLDKVTTTPCKSYTIIVTTATLLSGNAETSQTWRIFH
jgi:hypothetical protein